MSEHIPPDWARKLSKSPDLHEVLKARAVQLALEAENAVAIRAIEKLLEWPERSGLDEFEDVTFEALALARARARGFIEAQESAGE